MNIVNIRAHSQNKSGNYNLYPFICMIYLTLDLLSYLYVYYIVNICSFVLSLSVFFFTTTYIVTDIVVETYGYKYARRLIWLGLICEAFFSFFVYILASLHLNVVSTNHINIILSQNILRIFIASLITTPVGDFVNSYAISKWKIHFKGKYFALRSIFATTLGIIVYCIISHTILFYGVISINHLIILMASSILFKFLYVSICALPANILMRLVKSVDKVDQYDFNTNYNPFYLN